MAPLRYAAKFDPSLSLDCAPTPATLAQSKERKGSNFAIWQHCSRTCGDGEVLKLLLPRSVKNARLRLNDTNACVVEPTRGLAIAGVRRDIFVWSLEKQELLRKGTLSTLRLLIDTRWRYLCFIHVL